MTESSVSEPPPAPDLSADGWEEMRDRGAVAYDPDTETYRTSFDSATQSVSNAIISTVAAASETPPMELPPLCSAIDAEAIETIVDRAASADGDVRVSFPFAGYDITVASFGIITLRPQRDRQTSNGETGSSTSTAN